MRVIVFGATGRVGQRVVECLLADGHRVAVYVRNVVKVPSTWGANNVKVFVGGLGDKIKISKAIETFDAVISLLGDQPDVKSNTGIVEGVRNILEAMRAHNTLRFIGIAPSDIPDPVEPTGASRNFRTRCCLLRTPRFKSLEAACRLVMADEDLQWSLVRCKGLVDASSFLHTRRLEGFFDFSDKATHVAAVADAASFIAELVRPGAPFLRRCPGVATVQSLTSSRPSRTASQAPPQVDGGVRLVALQPAVQHK